MPKEKDKVYTITNFKIGKVYEGPDGTKQIKGKTIPWQILNFYVDHPKCDGKKFQKFVNPDKPEERPKEGTPIASMEFTIKESGDFTNYNVTKITYVQDEEEDPFAKPESKPESDAHAMRDKLDKKEAPPAKNGLGKESPIWFCTRYMTDIMQTLIDNGITGGKSITLKDAEDQIAQSSLALYGDIKKGLPRFDDK